MILILPFMIDVEACTWKMKNCSIDDTKKYAKWLLKNHPKETPTDWITCLNKIEKGILNGITLVKIKNVNTMLDTYIRTYIHYMCVVLGIIKSKGLKTPQWIVTV